MGHQRRQGRVVGRLARPMSSSDQASAERMVLQASIRPFTEATDFSGQPLLGRQLEVDGLLDAAGADQGGHADIGVGDAELALQVGGGRQDALLVLEVDSAMAMAEAAGLSAEPVFKRATISPPPLRVRSTMASSFFLADQPILTRLGQRHVPTVE